MKQWLLLSLGGMCVCRLEVRKGGTLTWNNETHFILNLRISWLLFIQLPEKCCRKKLENSDLTFQTELTQQRSQIRHEWVFLMFSDPKKLIYITVGSRLNIALCRPHFVLLWTGNMKLKEAMTDGTIHLPRVWWVDFLFPFVPRESYVFAVYYHHMVTTVTCEDVQKVCFQAQCKIKKATLFCF